MPAKRTRPGAISSSGVWAAGNLVGIRAQVLMPAASGLIAGAAINAYLVTEDARRVAQACGHRPPYGGQARDERCRCRAEVWNGDPDLVVVASASTEAAAPGTSFATMTES